MLLIGCATVDRYPPKLKQGCKNQFSCAKLKNMNRCDKPYKQAMSQWCRNQITPWWRTQVVKVYCKKSCCRRKWLFNCKFILCLFQIYIINSCPKWLCIQTSNLAVAIDCEWGSWRITDCSSTCGIGTRTKKRTVAIKETHGGKCIGKSRINEPCKIKNCPSRGFILFFLNRYILL